MEYEWEGSAKKDSKIPDLTTGWKLVPFMEMGKNWGRMRFGSGVQIKSSFCTHDAGNVRELASGDVGRQLNI